MIWNPGRCQSLAAEPIHFSQDVRPILAEYCLQCHGPDEAQRQADLRLDIADTGSATAIVAGKPDESEILARILSADPQLQMPPPEMVKRPSSAEIETLRQWIEAGAGFEGHWSFQPVRRPDLPQPARQFSSDIDRFIVTALEAKGLGLSPAVDRQQLIRRASFDLHGLPPTPEEVAAFTEDPDPNAFAKLIDRLAAVAALRRALGPTLAGHRPLRGYSWRLGYRLYTISVLLYLSRLRHSSL